jgi:hypothetical protein
MVKTRLWRKTHLNLKKSVLVFLLSINDSNESIDFVHGKSKFFIEVLDELELFIDKKVIFDEKKISVCRLSANFLICITLFPFNLDTSPFQVKFFF